MTAFNVVRFRLNPGLEQDFIEAHRKVHLDWPGMRRMALVKSGTERFFIVGAWDDMAATAAARPKTIATLDSFRHMLDDVGDGLGLTDPASGPAVLNEAGPR